MKKHELPYGKPMIDTTQGDPAHIQADNLRVKSDKLLERCGYERGNLGADGRYWWRGRDGSVVRWHPKRNAQDAIDLVEAMGLKIEEIMLLDNGNYQVGMVDCLGGKEGPTIAEAVCAAIEAALGDPA